MTDNAIDPHIEPGDALKVAHADALTVYGDACSYRIQIVLEDDGWHIDYELRKVGMVGGGPHYIIDASTGEIRWKRYEQ